MTETSTVVCMQPLEVQQVTDGSAGRLFSGTKIRVIGSDGKPVSYDQPGELHVLGPQTYVLFFPCSESSCNFLACITHI